MHYLTTSVRILILILSISTSYASLALFLSIYGISGTPLNWFRSYLSRSTDVSMTITINNKLSQPTLLNFGIPYGSVQEPILFILYTKPLTILIRRHSISNQSFADDTQLHCGKLYILTASKKADLMGQSKKIVQYIGSIKTPPKMSCFYLVCILHFAKWPDYILFVKQRVMSLLLRIQSYQMFCFLILCPE